MKKFKLPKNKYALIDNSDFEKINKYKWFVYKRKTGIDKFVAITHIYENNKRKTIYMHRMIMDVNNKKVDIDHINGDTLDNRKKNLRECSRSQNLSNTGMHADNTSGYKGVNYDKKLNKYQARICINYKKINLGYYETAKEAALKYNLKAKELFKEYAYLNKIKEDDVANTKKSEVKKPTKKPAPKKVNK